MRPVLVTGASGFIGRALCHQLRSHEWEVRAATRTLTEGHDVSAVAVGDIGPDTDWSVALAGCEAVIHLAAHVHVMQGQSGDAAKEFTRVNVQGSEKLARQAALAGVKRFLFLSSVKVNGERSAGRGFVESDPPAPVDRYGASKAEAESRLKEVAFENGMELVIVRPPLVYGPGVAANFLKLLGTVDGGVPLPLASIRNRRSLIYLGNLVHALGACLSHRDAANRTFFVSDDEDVSTPQLIREIAAALGKQPRLLPFPPGWLRAVAFVSGRSDQMDRLTGSLQVDISSIESALGWRPPHTLQQGLEQTVSWYRAQFGS
ncbi:MAG: SDR family oxidoreductase [Betaproteobacteria bacterium]